MAAAGCRVVVPALCVISAELARCDAAKALALGTALSATTRLLALCALLELCVVTTPTLRCSDAVESTPVMKELCASFGAGASVGVLPLRFV